MLQMNQNYEPEFKKKIVRLHLEEGRFLKGLAAEYGVSKASISIWTKQFREECQTSEEAKVDYDYMKENLLLHSDQGSQYTSKEFTEFCEKLGITQSMSKAGYPYDNAPMERYFNTLKNDLIYQHYYRTEDELYTAVEEFAYVQYNHVRPHSYNNYKTPYEARYGVA